MTRTAFLIGATLAGATLLGCSAGDDGGSATSFGPTPLTTLTSESAALTVEVRTAPEQPPSRGVTAVEYRVSGKDGAPVSGLVLSVVPWMPDMGHGTSITPTVEEMGDGRYVISDVELFMPGQWDLRTAVTGPLEDSVAPTFQIP
jgi:YtkA-like